MRLLRTILFAALLVCIPKAIHANDISVDTLSVQIKEAYNAALYADAAGLCDKAIYSLQESEDYNHLTMARLLDYKGMSERMLGEYEEAEACYRDEIPMLADFPSRADDVRCKLAVLYIEMGLYANANNVLDSVNDPKYTGWSMVHRASVYVRQGKQEEAIRLLKEVIAQYPDRQDLMVSAHQNIGFFLMESKDRNVQSDALLHLRYALDKMESDQLQYYTTLANIALLEARMGNFASALGNINEVVDWYERAGNTSLTDYRIAIRKRAKILFLMGNIKHSSIAYKDYYTKEKEYAMKSLPRMTEQNRLDFWKTLKPGLSEVFSLENHCPDFLLDAALFRREVSLLGEAEALVIAKRLSITGQNLRKALRKNEIAVDFVRYQKKDSIWYGAIIVPSSHMGGEIRFIPLWTEDELHGFKLENGRRLDDALCSSNMTDKDVLYTSTPLRHFIWNKLDAILEQYDYEDIYFAPDGILHLFAIEYLREDDGVCLHRLTTLSNLINRSVHKISGKSRMLAAGGFDYDAEGRGPTGDDSISNHDAIEYLQSKLNDNIEHPFTYLGGAKVEIDSISDISPFKTDSTTIQTEKQLKDNIANKKYSILHLSTHGYALDVDVPVVPEALRDSITEDKSLLASGIAFTSANVAYKDEKQDDGIISAREFCELDMSHIDLVALSACQTGLGHFSDEGPAGLVRGLKKAGAGALIVSLWNVSDEATMLFMKHFYRAMSEQSKIDIHAAFNTARVNFSVETYTYKMRVFDAKRMKAKTASSEGSYDKPRYRNPFILIDAIN